MANPHFLNILKEKILQKMQLLNGNKIFVETESNHIEITDFSKLKPSKLSTKHINMIDGAMKEENKSLGNSTIRKLFGMDENRNKDGDFNTDTLDVFSKFIEDKSWAALCKKNDSTTTVSTHPTDVLWLKECLKKGSDRDIKTVLDFVNCLHVPDDKKIGFDTNYNYEKSIAYLLGEAFVSNKKLKNTNLLAELAKTKAGQLHFYESFVVSDDYYMTALENFYLNKISYKSRTNAKDESFACALLYEHYRKNNKPKLMNKMGKRLFGNVSEEEATLANMQDTRPYARFWAQKMLYLHHNEHYINMNDIENKLRSCQGIGEISFAISQLVQSLYVLGRNEHLIEVYEDFMSANNPADIYTNDWYLRCMLPMWKVVTKTYLANNQQDKAHALIFQILQNNVENKDIFSPEMRLFTQNWSIIKDFEKMQQTPIIA